jgi:hypothetical protein
MPHTIFIEQIIKLLLSGTLLFIFFTLGLIFFCLSWILQTKLISVCCLAILSEMCKEVFDIKGADADELPKLCLAGFLAAMSDGGLVPAA